MCAGAIANMDDDVKQGETVIYMQLTLRVEQNSFVLVFELVVPECFYVIRNLFPDFGYGKLKYVFAII